MKFKIFFFLLILSINSHSQECYHRVINPIEKKAINEYINLAIKNHWFINDKGIIKVIERLGNENDKYWEVSVLIDDSYQTNLPESFATFFSDVILFYSDTTLKYEKTEEVIKLLDSVILDRVYITPPQKTRKIVMTFGGLINDPPILDNNKQPKIVEVRRNCLDNCNHNYLITFDGIGGYKFKEY